MSLTCPALSRFTPFHPANFANFKLNDSLHWLICSAQTQDAAASLLPWIESLTSSTILVELRTVGDVFAPDECYEAVYDIHNSLPKLPGDWRIDDLISDFTGMTAQASIGMALACISAGSDLQYTPAQTIGGKTTGESLQPIAVTHKNSQFMKLT